MGRFACLGPARRHRLGAVLAFALVPCASAQVLTYQDATGAIATLALEGGNTEVECGDVDGDGNPDLVSIGDHGSPLIGSPQHGITLWRGDGQGGWTLSQTGDFGYGGVALGDANGDGIVDLGYAMHHNWSATDFGDQLIEVALGDGSGVNWTPWDDGLATSGETYGMFGVDFADVDGDGDLDVGSNSFGCCAGVHVYRNHGDGTWSQSFGFLGGNSNHQFQFADVNGDGRADVVSSNQLGVVWLGNGNGAFAAGPGGLPAGTWTGTGVGDADGDGRDEVSFVTGGGLRVWSLGAGGSWQDRSGNLPASGTFAETDLRDMDADGRADLIGYGGGQVAIFRNATGNAWTSIGTHVIPGVGSMSPRSLRGCLDLDHNGLPDLSVVFNEPAGTFSTKNRHVVLFETTSPASLEPHPISPGLGRRWIQGQARFVEWTCAVPGTDLGNVTIELSTHGVAGPWVLLAAGLANGGRHQLRAPYGADSSVCRVRLSIATTTGSASAIGPEFSILAAPVPPITGYGAGCPGTGGFVPHLEFIGHTAPGETLTLSLANGQGGAAALLLLGTHQVDLPLGFGCRLLVGPFPVLALPGLVLAGTGAGQGSLVVPFVMPVLPPGTAVTAQSFIADAASPLGFANSAGVRIVAP